MKWLSEAALAAAEFIDNYRLLNLRKKASRGPKIVEYTAEIMPLLTEYVEQSVPLSFIWFDENSEPYGGGAYIAIYSKKNDMKVNHGRLSSAYEMAAENKGCALIAIDFIKNESNKNKLKEMVPELKENGVSEVIYLSMHPTPEKVSLIHKNGKKKT